MVIAATLLATAVSLVDAHDIVQVLLLVNVSNVVDVVVDSLVKRLRVAVIEVLVNLEGLLVLMKKERVDVDTVVDTVVEKICVAVIEVLVKLEELLLLMEEEEVDEDAVVDTVVVHVPVVVGSDEDMVSSYTSLRRARSLCIPPTMYIRLSPDTQKPRKKARLLGSEPPGLTSCHRLA